MNVASTDAVHMLVSSDHEATTSASLSMTMQPQLWLPFTLMMQWQWQMLFPMTKLPKLWLLFPVALGNLFSQFKLLQGRTFNWHCSWMSMPCRLLE